MNQIIKITVPVSETGNPDIKHILDLNKEWSTNYKSYIVNDITLTPEEDILDEMYEAVTLCCEESTNDELVYMCLGWDDSYDGHVAGILTSEKDMLIIEVDKSFNHEDVESIYVNFYVKGDIARLTQRFPEVMSFIENYVEGEADE